MATKQQPHPRTLQEWMERTGTNGRRLVDLVRRKTGRDISPTMLSFILRGSRRCSRLNALALSDVTGVSIDALTEWPRVSIHAKPSGKRSSHAA